MISPISDAAHLKAISLLIKLLHIAVRVQKSTHRRNVNNISKTKMAGYNTIADPMFSVFPSLI